MIHWRQAAMAFIVLCLTLEAAMAQKGKLTLLPEEGAIELVSPVGRWPEFAAGQKRRMHVWHDNGTWHFRSTCGGNATVFDGTVTLDKGRVRVVGGDGELEDRGKEGNVKNPKKADYFRLMPNGLAFRLQSFGKLDGLDFTVPKEAKTIRFEFRVNNESNPEFIFIGANGEHPKMAAFVLKAHP